MNRTIILTENYQNWKLSSSIVSLKSILLCWFELLNCLIELPYHTGILVTTHGEMVCLLSNRKYTELKLAAVFCYEHLANDEHKYAVVAT